MNHSTIIGSGHYVPPTRVTNEMLSTIVDTSDEWIKSRTGIEARHISIEESTSELAYQAAIRAIDQYKINKNDIDLIIVATLTPDHFTPSCACMVQAKLGLNQNQVMAFDINAACTGFLFALQIATSMINLGQLRCALVIGAETMSKIIDWADRNTCILFGDGAGAMILKYREEGQKILHYSASKGDVDETLVAKTVPIRPLFTPQLPNRYYLQMDGKEVFRFALEAMSLSITKILALAKVTMEEIDWIIPHQANLRIIQSVMRKHHIPKNKVYINLQEYGNTSAASIPMAFAQLQESGQILCGSKVLLVGFGAGLTWGATYLEF